MKIFLLFTIPLTILAITLLSLQTNHLVIKNESSQICETGTMKLQGLRKKAIDAIFILNAQALNLRLQMIQAQIRLIASAGHPAAFAAALANFNRILNLQIKLENQQNQIIRSSNRLAQIAMLALRAEIFSVQSRNSPYFKQILPTRITWTDVKFQPLAIEPDSFGGRAPIYQYKDKFESNQTLQASWKIHQQTPEQTGRVEWNQFCGATLKKGTKLFTGEPILTRDKL